ncbi:MAG: HepT-like ribonuclease domain-containing protein [Acidimicrobiales bacterium]
MPAEADRAALSDIAEYADRITRHATDPAVLDDELAQAGILRWLGVVGEAASRVSPELRDRHPDVPWRQIIAMRNILVHVYDQVDVRLVWAAVERLPDLIAKVKAIVDELSGP